MTAELNELLLEFGNVGEDLSVQAHFLRPSDELGYIVYVEALVVRTLGVGEGFLENQRVWLPRAHFIREDLVVKLMQNAIVRIDVIIVALRGVGEKNEAKPLPLQTLNNGPKLRIGRENIG